MASAPSSAAAPGLVNLVCPRCRKALSGGGGAYACAACGLNFPRRADVDVLLDEDEWRDLQKHLGERRAVHAAYVHARRVAPLGRLYFDRWVGRMFAMALEGRDAGHRNPDAGNAAGHDPFTPNPSHAARGPHARGEGNTTEGVDERTGSGAVFLRSGGRTFKMAYLA